MFNDFVMVGPPNDPARVKNRAFRLWASAGVVRRTEKAVPAASGLGATLGIAATRAQLQLRIVTTP